ncbi:MAG: AzlC family ABC transporter permease [Chloroflexi bacterium]|nr:AzlC family ABC transporter permease [Chloroflexota bacterium]
MRPFVHGFTAMLPLWMAAAPTALAYSLAARQAGISEVEIQLMSMMIYSAPTQIAFTQLWSANTPMLSIVLMVLILNIHLMVYGLSLSRRISFSPVEKAVAAFSLTDAVYSITLATQKGNNFGFLLGAEASMFLAWNLFTFVALLSLPVNNGVAALPVDFIGPLIFFVLLMSILRTNMDVIVAIVAVSLSVLFTFMGLGNSVIISVSLTGPLLGVWLVRSRGGA